jgi:hypothetical protein
VTPEQQGTLAHVTAEYNKWVILKSRGLVKTTKEWHRYNDAVANFYGYRLWLDAFVLKRAA